MAAPAAAVRPFAGGVPARRAAPVLSCASEEGASGKKRPRLAPARDTSSACLTRTTRNRSSVVTAAGEVLSSQELLQKAELVSRRGGGACKGGAPTAGKKERFLASNQRHKPFEEDSGAPSMKRTKISTPVEQKQKQIRPPPPQMSPEKSKDDIKVAEESKDGKLAEESKGKQEEEYADISGGLSFIVETGRKPRPRSSGDSDSDTKVVQQSTGARKVQDAQRAAPKAAVDMRALLYRANLRRQLLEKERAALPDQSIDPRELQRLAVLASRSVAIRASCATSIH